MKKMRETSEIVKKLKKTKPDKLTIFLFTLPIVVAILAVATLIFLPATAQNQAEIDPYLESKNSSDTTSIIDKINVNVDVPEPESQEVSIQIAEQRRVEAEKLAQEKAAQEAEKKRLEEEKILAKKKELEIAQAREDAKNKICFIGDSITFGGGADRTIDIFNSGHPIDNLPYDRINIARNGSTTSDWTASIASDINHCRKPNLRAVMIMLGTNDAGLSVLASTYVSNMNQIKSVASGLGVPVIVNCPIMIETTEASKSRISEYCSNLGANGVNYPLNVSLADGIHPDANGYYALASAWATVLRSIGI